MIHTLHTIPGKALTRLHDRLTHLCSHPDATLAALGTTRAHADARLAGVTQEIERRYHVGTRDDALTSYVERTFWGFTSTAWDRVMNSLDTDEPEGPLVPMTQYMAEHAQQQREAIS